MRQVAGIWEIPDGFFWDVRPEGKPPETGESDTLEEALGEVECHLGVRP